MNTLASQVLQSFPSRERRKSVLFRLDVSPHLLGIRFGVFAESPSDRLLKEELLRLERGLDAIVEQRDIGFALEAQLADDGCPPEPHVGRQTP